MEVGEKTLNRTRDDERATAEKGLVDERVARENQWRHLGRKRQRSDGKACAKGPPRVGGARKKRREVSCGQGGWNAEEEKEEEVVVLVSTGWKRGGFFYPWAEDQRQGDVFWTRLRLAHLWSPGKPPGNPSSTHTLSPCLNAFSSRSFTGEVVSSLWLIFPLFSVSHLFRPETIFSFFFFFFFLESVVRSQGLFLGFVTFISSLLCL